MSTGLTLRVPLIDHQGHIRNATKLLSHGSLVMLCDNPYLLYTWHLKQWLIPWTKSLARMLQWIFYYSIPWD